MRNFILIACSLVLAGCGGQGKMPTDSAAAAVRQDALRYVDGVGAKSDVSAMLPRSIVALSPLSARTYSNGLLVVFRKRFVEDYGFYYCADSGEPPPQISAFCKKLSPGFFRYNNPG